MSNSTSPSVKSKKHIELNYEIKNLEGLCDRVRDLVIKIKGPDPAEITSSLPKLTENEPTLSEVLYQGPADIKMRVDEIHSLLTEIEEALFNRGVIFDIE